MSDARGRALLGSLAAAVVACQSAAPASTTAGSRGSTAGGVSTNGTAGGGTTALTATSGSSGASTTAASTTSSGVTGSASTGGAGTTSGGNSTVLFTQPTLTGVQDNVNFFVRSHPANGVFSMILLQTSPYSTDGGLVPTTWDAGLETGLFPPAPLGTYQEAMQDLPGSTTVQIAGDTVGAYLNSASLWNNTRCAGQPPACDAGNNCQLCQSGICATACSIDDKQMITPQLTFDAGIALFSNAANVLSGSFDLQIPVAENGTSDGPIPLDKSNTYASLDFLLSTNVSTDPVLSLGIGVFLNGGGAAGDTISQDDVTKEVLLNADLGVDGGWLTQPPGSPGRQSEPWDGGFKTFAFSMSGAQFQLALDAAAQATGLDISAPVNTDAGAYQLTQFHLNAEMHYGAGPAQLGWSMRHLELTLTTP